MYDDDDDILQFIGCTRFTCRRRVEEVWKAKFVVQGYHDRMKPSLVHERATARQNSTKMLVGLASLFGFRLLATDGTQAYRKSAENLM